MIRILLLLWLVLGFGCAPVGDDDDSAAGECSSPPYFVSIAETWPLSGVVGSDEWSPHSLWVHADGDAANGAAASIEGAFEIGAGGLEGVIDIIVIDPAGCEGVTEFDLRDLE